jgi:hypothetical protein
MDCAEAKLRIESYVTGTLPGDEKGALESHLEACAECRLDTELTRAAHSNPSAPAVPAPAPPPEPAPAASSTSNWTIDSIFGAPAPGKQPAASAPPAHEVVEPSRAPESAPAPEPPAEPAPEFGVPAAFATTSAQEDSFENVLADDPAPSHASEPEPEVELPTALDGPPPSPLRAGASRNGDDETEDPGESSDRAGWDFEPADQKDGMMPPEGSLFFAEEALGRSKKKAKGSFVKVAFWILGGIVGLGLLGVSVWIALAMRGESPEQARQDPAHESTPPGQTAPPAVTPAGATAPTAELGAAQDPSTPHEGAPHKETSETAPAADATAEAPTRAHEEGHRSGSAPPKTSIPPKAANPTKSAQSLAAERTARELAALPTPWRNPPPRPAPRKPVPVDDADDFAPPAEKPRVHVVKPPVPVPAKQVETSKAPAALDSSAMVAIERTLASPPTETPAPSTETTTPPAAETTAPQKTAPAPETLQRPLDRLHLATLEAEQGADVPALRKLRDTWRGLARTSVGPDRARAKRELADCLWAIQTMTSRTSDQKAALAAYRDYVLNAPAGGADPRTVARMRQLEDALSESH